MRGDGAVTVVVLALVTIAAYVLATGSVVYLVWNDFVVTHAHGLHRTSYWASAGVGALVACLTYYKKTS